MLDSPNSTLSSASDEAAKLMKELLTADVPSEDELRRQGEDLAMAVAYTWNHHDRAAQEIFLDRLLALNPGGIGLMIAVDVYSQARLFGIQPGSVRADVEITTRWTPPVQPAAAEGGEATNESQEWVNENLAVITDLWTGIATGNTGRWLRAKAALYELPLPQVREVLRIMAYDASVGMEQFASWQAGGADALDDYRREVPLERTFHPPPTGTQP